MARNRRMSADISPFCTCDCYNDAGPWYDWSNTWSEGCYYLGYSITSTPFAGTCCNINNQGRGRGRRAPMSNMRRGRAYNKGGRVNTNNRGRFSGRTQNNPKGKPKK